MEDIQPTAAVPSSPSVPKDEPVPSQASGMIEGPAPPIAKPPTPEPTPTPAPPAPPPSEEPVPSHVNGVIEGGPPGLPPLPPLGGIQDLPLPEERQQPAGIATPDQIPGGHEPSSFGEELIDSGAHRPAHELDQTLLAGPSPSTTEEQPEDGGLVMEGTMREDAPLGSDPFGDETGGDISATPQESGPSAEWGNIAIGGLAAPDSAGSGFDLAEGSGYELPQPAPMEEPVEQTPPARLGEAAPDTSLVPAYQPETGTSGGGKKRLVLLLLLAALAGGGYFAYPTVMELIQSRGQQTEGTLTPANVQVKALTRTDGKIIYSVRGEVRNESTGNVGMIQVEAQFRNASGDVLKKVTSFSGNLFEDSDLVSLDLNLLQSDLQNELGQSLSNASIPPGKAVPFLIILDNPPSGISKVTVTIVSFKETT